MGKPPLLGAMIQGHQDVTKVLKKAGATLDREYKVALKTTYVNNVAMGLPHDTPTPNPNDVHFRIRNRMFGMI